MNWRRGKLTPHAERSDTDWALARAAKAPIKTMEYFMLMIVESERFECASVVKVVCLGICKV